MNGYTREKRQEILVRNWLNSGDKWVTKYHLPSTRDHTNVSSLHQSKKFSWFLSSDDVHIRMHCTLPTSGIMKTRLVYEFTERLKTKSVIYWCGPRGSHGPLPVMKYWNGVWSQRSYLQHGKVFLLTLPRLNFLFFSSQVLLMAVPKQMTLRSS